MRVFIFLLVALLASQLVASETQDIYKLKQKIIEVTHQQNQLLQHNEVIANQRLASYQSKLLIKTLSYEIYLFLKRQGVKRSIPDIENILIASYACSWTFTDFGHDHIERFINIVQWPRDESCFQPKMVCHWKAGTYLESIHKMVLKDSNDYGAYQINEMHIKSLRNMNHLYNSGIINIKVKKIKTAKDLMDINTNCVARCVIEVDRKSRGWEWKHIRDKKFHSMIISKIEQLEKQHLYNRTFVEKYYFTTPVKHYTAANFSF